MNFILLEALGGNRRRKTVKYFNLAILAILARVANIHGHVPEGDVYVLWKLRN